MRTLAAAAVFAIGIAPAWAQDHEHCPMAGAREHRAGVDHRHDEATGVGHDASEHHFVLAGDGGSIRLEVKDAADTMGRDRIREHLRQIARAFADGDFSLPRRIHDQAPPGVDVMTARRAEIRYAYAPTARGGLVTISTRDAQALTAIHAFLRFQISDHGTGDPTE
jgi:hypothetical protein